MGKCSQEKPNAPKWILLMTLAIAVSTIGLSLPQFSSAISDKELIITGENASKLDAPMGVAADGNRIYVANANQHQITVFDSKGDYVTQIGRKGSGDGELQYPVDIALAPSGELYVADFHNQRVQVFGQNGEFLRQFPKDRSIKPAALTVSPKGDLIVSDVETQTIKIYSSAGNLIREFGGQGEADGKFKFANGVAVDSGSGDIYVSDSQNSRIQVFTQEGKFLRSIRVTGGFGLPKGISYSDNKLYVADTLLHKVFVLDSAGNLLETRGEQRKTFHFPNDVFVKDGTVFVADRGSNQILVNGK